MKRSIIHVFLIVSFLNTFTFAQSDMISAKSVVKLVTSYQTVENGKTVKKVSTGSAWCWKESTLLVTALHVVAGMDKIVVNKNNEKTCNAKVVSVLLEADLALIRMDSDLGLTPLQLETVSPNSTSEYSVWGFPQGVYSIQGDDIRFSRSLESIPTLNSILTGNDLKNDLRVQGYPLPNARVLRISSIIQPGHSGAPIFTLSGKVIGVADGGLRGGTARLNWATPAAYYVPQLLSSKDTKPVKASMQVSLYSNTITVEADNTDVENQKEIEKNKIETEIKGTNGSVKNNISKSWTTNFRTIYKTLPISSKSKWDDYIKSNSSINFWDEKYDVYENFVTGASFTVPDNSKLSVESGWFYAHNTTSDMHYYALPFDAKSYSNSLTQIKPTMKSIMDHFTTSTQWKTIPNRPDKWKEDSETNTAYYETLQMNDLYTFNYIAKVKGNTLLVTAVIYLNEKYTVSNPDYIKQVGHYFMAQSMMEINGNVNEVDYQRGITCNAGAVKYKNTDPTVYKSCTVNFKSIFSILNTENKAGWSEYIKTNQSNEIWNEEFDVYNNFETGASFVVPAQTKLTLQSGWFYAHNSTSDMHYYALPFDAKSFENAIAQITTTQNSLLDIFKTSQQWVVQKDWVNKWQQNTETKTAYFETRQENGKHVVNFTARVKGNFLLVSAVIYEISKYHNGNPEYVKQVGQYYMSQEIGNFN